MLDLSICMIVKDEEENLRELLPWIRNCGAEIIIVDTGSLDNSKSMIKEAIGIVHDFKWIRDFAAARNYSLSLATCSWVLWLDADDRIDEVSFGELKNHITQHPLNLSAPQAYRLTIHSPIQPDHDSANIQEETFKQLRVFPREVVCPQGIQFPIFRSPIHEEVRSSLEELGVNIQDLDISIEHRGYLSPETRKLKTERNFEILQTSVQSGSNDPYLFMEYGHSLYQKQMYEEALTQYAKIWQLSLSDHLEVKRFTPVFIANAFKKMNQLEDAIDWYTLSIDQYPEIMTAHYEYARILTENGSPQKAFSSLKKSIQQGPVIGSIPQDYRGVMRNIWGLHSLLQISLGDNRELFKQVLTWKSNQGRSRLAIQPGQLAEFNLNDIPVDPWIFVECAYELGEFVECASLIQLLKLVPSNSIQRQIVEDIPKQSANLVPLKKAPHMKPSEVNQLLGTIQQPLNPRGPLHTLTVCMIVKNEEKNIKAAIESFTPFADEIIVNDTGSSDNTINILKSLPVQIIQTEWEDDFSLARNASLAQASCSWIIWMDADDRVPEDQVENFLKLKTAPLDRCFGFQIVNTQGGLPIGTRFMQTRMFPNHPDIRFERKIHEQMIFSAARLGLHSKYTDTLIWHTGYEDPVHKKLKAQRNLDLLLDGDTTDDPIIPMQIGDSLAILERFEEAAKAYQEAYHTPGCREHNEDAWKEIPNSIGRCLQQAGRFDEALVWFKNGEEHGPEKVEPWFYQGETLIRLNRWDEARFYFEKAISLERVFSGVGNQYDVMRIYSHKYLCEIHLRNKDWKEAHKISALFLQFYPQVVEAHLFLGKSQMGVHQFEEAERSFKAAIEMNPTASLEAWQALLTCLDLLNRDTEFLKIREEMKQHFPEHAAAHHLGESPTPDQAAERSQTDLSICLIVKNETKNIAACLASLQSLDAELIVVDTGSEDNTIEQAQEAGAHVYHFPWINDFGAARNESLKMATGRWIMWVDADDRLPASEVSRLLQLVQEDADKGYGFIVKNTTDGGLTGSVFNQIRLFPNRKIFRFTGKVHEQILPSLQAANLPVDFLNLTIHHTGYLSHEVMIEKQQRNLAILLHELETSPNVKTPVRLFSIAGAYFDMKEYEEAITWYRQSLDLAQETGQDPHVRDHVPIKIAECRANQGNLQQALDMVQKALSSNPCNEDGKMLEAQMLKHLDRLDQASHSYMSLFVFQEGQSMLPVDYQRLHLGAIKFLADYFKSNQKETLAIEILKLGIEIGKGEKVSSQKVLSLLFDAEEFGLCLTLLQQEAHFIQDADHYLNLGKIYILLNKAPAALKALQVGVKKYPNDPEIKQLYQALLADLGV